MTTPTPDRPTTLKVKKLHVSVFCLCGASMTGWVSPSDKLDALKATWLAVHHGEGHGPATCQQATAARRRAERKEVAR